VPTWKSFAEYGLTLEAWERDMTGPEQRKVTRAMGVEAQRIASRAAVGDLGGDRAFGGWNRGRPIPLDTRLRPGRDAATILSPTRSSAGPWTVAEFGRNQGNAGGFSGPGINRRTGITSRTKSGGIRGVRARRSRRWNGATAGKGTASDAVAEIGRKLPPIADKAVLRVMRKRFDVIGG
jgi:hypothetical protein